MAPRFAYPSSQGHQDGDRVSLSPVQPVAAYSRRHCGKAGEMPAVLGDCGHSHGGRNRQVGPTGSGGFGQSICRFRAVTPRQFRISGGLGLWKSLRPSHQRGESPDQHAVCRRTAADPHPNRVLADTAAHVGRFHPEARPVSAIWLGVARRTTRQSDRGNAVGHPATVCRARPALPVRIGDGCPASVGDHCGHLPQLPGDPSFHVYPQRTSRTRASDVWRVAILLSSSVGSDCF